MDDFDEFDDVLVGECVYVFVKGIHLVPILMVAYLQVGQRRVTAGHQLNQNLELDLGQLFFQEQQNVQDVSDQLMVFIR